MEAQPPDTVSVATGALGPVLHKLTVLLRDEQQKFRFGAGTRGDIESITSMLASLHSLLLKLWEREDLGTECRKWMDEARVLSYDMEDDIDSYMLGLEHSDIDISHGEMNKLLRHLKTRVEAVSRRCRQEWKTAAPDGAISISNKRSKPSPANPRFGFLHKDFVASYSEGFGFLHIKEFSELLNRLDYAHMEMVCIHGFAGTGKTTLANMVYKEIRNTFDCGAFVSLSKYPDMMEVLGAILNQVSEGVPSVERTCTEPTHEENLIHDISTFLSGKRYVVIVDDIWLWQSWEIIRRALPKGNQYCRIIATTRVNSIAEKCLTEENAIIYRHSGFDASAIKNLLNTQHVKNDWYRRYADKMRRDLLTMIADMCGGMTLAVWCLLAELEEAGFDYYDWRKVSDYLQVRQKFWHMLLGGLLSNAPALAPMVESLRLGYDDLPVHYKTCLLYCSIFPSGYKIERHGLVRKWITQGFFPKGPEQEKEAAAEACLDELVNMGLLQQEQASLAGEKTSYCRVHPMMRAFLLWRSKEANFATCLELPPYDCPPSYAAATCPLFVGFHAAPDTISAMNGPSRARSLVVFGCSSNSSSRTQNDNGCLIPRQKMESVQVLSIENNRVPLCDTDLVAVCRQMTRLRHLDVSDTSIRELQIRKLHHLKTLNLPAVIYPQKDSPAVIIDLPCCLSSSSVSVLVGGKEVKLPAGIWSWPVIPGENLSILMYFNLCQPQPVAGLKVGRTHTRVPEWIKQHRARLSTLDIKLCQLVDDDLYFLCNKMPYLHLLALRLEVLPRKAIVITGAGFSRLESFYLDCRLPMVTFQHGAMPNLEHLEFKFYTSRALTSKDPVGIRHLLSLRKIVFNSSPRYKSDAPGISSVINKVRQEAKEHPNKIIISINGKDEEVIQEKTEATKTTSVSDMISEENIVTSGGAGGSSGASMIKTSIPSPYDNSSDDEKGSIIPVKSYYPFGVAK